MGGDLLKQLFSQLDETTKASLLEKTSFTDVSKLVSRIPKDVHFQLINKIKEMCKSDGFQVFSTREFDDKMDHGDIDILYVDTRVDIRQRLTKLFNPLVIKRNGTITTFSHKHSDTEYFQIDFIHVTDENMAQFFLSYGDIGMTMGMIAYHNKLKYGDDGLHLKISGEQMNQLTDSTVFSSQEEHIFDLSQDPELIARFFQLDFDRWKMGFCSQMEAYEWLARSIFYDPHHFVPNEGKLKRHDKPKRKFMSGFDEYSKIVLESYVGEQKISNIIDYSLKFFNKFDEIMLSIKLLAEQRKLNIERSAKFSGKNFIEKGISGKKVGKAIAEFKEYVKSNFQLSFEEWLDSSSKEHVEIIFEEFFLQKMISC